ncbi:BCCT family transporter [Veillonella magna]|uniref:BCCT family transporter n=1 Tax=Veillonella magna TaxID=464322 RepID=A0ABS2GKM2_9FIRM|nr:BCCT family transporter [Veillonella magna]MBM6825419.1 BCCT family transporter [Veillonella magna]MBM6913714.1 BCCT family transporter [Veillonella magna]
MIKRNDHELQKKNIDWMITLFPFFVIIGIALFLFIFPIQSNRIISEVRSFLGDTLGVYYLIIGIMVFITSIWLAGSKYGNLTLGNAGEQPQYTFWEWGCMMFTCGLAADILFYSFSEWIMYASNPYVSQLGGLMEWAGVFPLFHWGFIPWSFYLVLAVAFAFMLHVKKIRCYRYSEACRPVIGDYADGILGRAIDIFALFALLAGTATTFSVATPLMSQIFSYFFHMGFSQTTITIGILLITFFVYTYAVLHGIRGIGILAKICIYIFLTLMLVVLFFEGETRFIIENGFQSFGKLIQHFIELSTYSDPGRSTNFPQDWTIYYWAYWMVWSVVVPFFIGTISKGRTIRQVIVGGYIFGVGATMASFTVLGNYSLGLQVSGIYNFIGQYEVNDNLYEIILYIVNTMPHADFVLGMILVCMILFYATSFDSIAYTASCYSYKNLNYNDKPNIFLRLLWCVLLIILPISLVFSESSMNNIQSISIISALPIGVIMIVIIYGLIKELGYYNDKNIK